MIIGVDIRPMAGLRTGVQEYTEQILAHLVALAPDHQFKLFFSSFRGPAPDRPWMHAPNVQLIEYRIPNNLLFLAGSVFDYPFIDRLLGGVDVFFSPHFFLAPLSKSCRRVTTFHDLSYLRFPEFFTWRKRWWHTVEMDPARQARFSNQIIAVSESTKADLIDYYQIDPANISVVHSGTAMTRPTEEALFEFKKTHSLPKRFILHVGTLEPRKNIIGLVRAFNILKAQVGYEDVGLALIGKEGWQFRDIFEEIKKSPYRSHIRYSGHVGGDLASYYSLATVCVCPSFFEGFGFPALEAMACGVPVVASANSSLPEVVGEAGLLINPYDISEIAEALEIVLSEPATRSRMIKKGLVQAAKFTWENAARRTLDILLKM
ncbi:MAG: glycosyltransferase family 1 protein [Patescibacteria group bacterium]